MSSPLIIETHMYRGSDFHQGSELICCQADSKVKKIDLVPN